MGDVTETFFAYAKEFYHGRFPDAGEPVTNLHNLEDVLSFVENNITEPIRNLIIVAHGNMDGTLKIGLNSADTDRYLSVTELRRALYPESNSSLLKQISRQIDSGTRIQIKGCNIGRNQEMVELIDDAFGGARVVTAPTHEHLYDKKIVPPLCRKHVRSNVSQTRN